jgi:hypothetical protein
MCEYERDTKAGEALLELSQSIKHESVRAISCAWELWRQAEDNCQGRVQPPGHPEGVQQRPVISVRWSRLI